MSVLLLVGYIIGIVVATVVQIPLWVRELDCDDWEIYGLIGMQSILIACMWPLLLPMALLFVACAELARRLDPRVKVKR